MEFAHIQKTSLVDYPEEICSTVFTIGCNFRCPFCYNKSLVIPEEFPKNPLTAEQVLKTLIGRKQFVSAVCITGGEPTIHEDLFDFIKSLKSNDFLVKLDTNGTNPEMVKKLLKRNLLDYIAVDIKTAPLEYAKATGLDAVDTSKIQETVQLIKNSSEIDYELRTTLVPTIHRLEDIEELGKWIGGGKKYSMQVFQRTDSLINPELANVTPFKENELEAFVNIAKKYFKDVELKNNV